MCWLFNITIILRNDFKLETFGLDSIVSLFLVGCESDSSKNKKFNTIIENFRNGMNE